MTILSNQIGATVILQLNRPRANAINSKMVSDLSEALEECAKNPSVKGVILTGLPGMFSGGLDVIDLYPRDREYMLRFWKDFTNLLMQLFNYPKLLFSAISGHSPAGGTVLAIMTDYRIMADGDYNIGLNEVAVGLILPHSIGQVYQYLLGNRQAEKLALTGALLFPRDAMKYGLVDEVCDPDQLESRCLKRMECWQKLPAFQQISTKLQMRSHVSEKMKESIKADVDKMVDIWFEPNFREVMGALVKKLTS
ncbi:MAG: enoyl-CoA hydratase/isomerase family protein [FCB group bacterium]|nr:enoyl-CoA hydratase/isomerase family protein [FCB group bacterium]